MAKLRLTPIAPADRVAVERGRLAANTAVENAQPKLERLYERAGQRGAARTANLNSISDPALRRSAAQK